MAAQDSSRKGGRPSKGERMQLKGRVPTQHHEFYERRRLQLGLSQADYVAFVMAKAEGLPIPGYIADVVDISSIRPHPNEGGAVAI